MTSLPQGFLDRPFAHRGLHGVACAENSLAAITAAIDAGYGIELDIQPSADGTPMVFHDYDLARLTNVRGPVSAHTAAALSALPLKGGGSTIPTLRHVLDTVRGRVPLLIEIKDQDGAMGARVGPLEQAVAETLSGYTGDIAVMSFNPHSAMRFGEAAPDVPRGIVTSAYTATGWPDLPDPTRAHLAGISDFDATGACFISHEMDALDMPRVADLKAQGVPILCWTVRSAAEEAIARKVADQITFEGYTPA